jgi:PIN domain nuclease of toxin-antitoxin system
VLHITHRKAKKVVHVKKFHKKTAKRITGITTAGAEFELVSVEPMEYYIEEYRDDLL